MTIKQLIDALRSLPLPPDVEALAHGLDDGRVADLVSVVEGDDGRAYLSTSRWRDWLDDAPMRRPIVRPKARRPVRPKAR